MTDFGVLIYQSIGIIVLLSLTIYFLVRVIKYITEGKNEKRTHGQEDSKGMRSSLDETDERIPEDLP